MAAKQPACLADGIKTTSMLMEKCHRGQIFLFAYSDTQLINGLGLAKSFTVARLSL